MTDKRITIATRLLIVGLWSLSVRAAETPTSGTQTTADRPRLIVLTNIGGGNPDDQQSLIRLIVHSKEFDIDCRLR